MKSQSSSRTGKWGPILKEDDFRRLWFVGLVLYGVRWLELLAIGVYAYQVTGSPFLVASLTMIRMLPLAVFGAVLGAVADRFDRRRTLVLIVAVSLAVSLTLAVVAALGHLAVWHLAIASFVGGTAWAADNPVRRVMQGQIVGPERMGAAMSFDAGTNHASRMVGPIVGGSVLAATGITGTFTLCAALQLLALIAALRVRPREPPATPPGATLLAGIAETFAAARRDPRMVGTLMVTLIFNLFAWPFISMVPVIGKDRLGLGPEGVGLLAGMDGIGAMLGAVLVATIVRPALYRRLYVGGLALYIAMIPVFALSTRPLLSGAALFLMGIGQAGFGIMQATIVYVAAPPEMRSRMLGVLTMFIGTAPLGVAQVGVLADLLGAHWAGVTLAAQGGLALLLARRWWRAI